VTESFQLLRQPGADPDTPFTIPLQAGVLVAQVYNRALASEVKLTLMEQFPDDHPVTVVYSAGVRGQERQRRIPLYDLDRLDDLDHLTSVYAPPLEAGPGIAVPDQKTPEEQDSGCPTRQRECRVLSGDGG
jgi:hypothetical protein